MKKKYYKFELNMTICNILCGVLFVILYGLYFLYLYNKGEIFNFDSISYGLLMGGLIVYIMIHEICHGLGYMLFVKDKKNIKFGALLEKGVFYAMCQEKISKKGILVSLFFPIFWLTIVPLIICCFIDCQLWVLLALMNLASAIGDIILMGLVFKLPKDIKYIDYDNVIGAYFVSKEDLSKYKSFGVKYIECGEDSKNLINKDIKFITVSKLSWVYLVGLVALVVVMELLF